MKKIKFLIVFVLMFVCFAFIGESYYDLFHSFPNYYAYTSIERQSERSEKQMVSDLLRASKENNVQFFTYNRKSIGLNSSMFTVYYSDKEVLNDLKTRFQLEKRTYKSLFFGSTEVIFTPFNEIDGIDNVEELRLIGTKENRIHFMSDINLYIGVEPHVGDGLTSTPKDSVFLIWTVAGLAVLFLTVYELLLNKKEYYVKIAYGERPIYIILKNIVINTVALSILFCLSLLLSMQLTYSEYLLPKSLIAFSVILLLNNACYFTVYRSNIKEAFSSLHLSPKFLTLNYGVKIVTVALTVCIISGNIALITDGVSYMKQRSFYEQYQGYNFLRISDNLDSGERTVTEDEEGLARQLSYEFYEECVKNERVVAQCFLENVSGVLYFNKTNMAYLTEQIKSLRDMDFNESKLYFLIPENMDEKEKEERLLYSKDFLNIFFRTGELTKDKLEVISYPDDVSLLMIDNNRGFHSVYVENPIVFFENVDADDLCEFYGRTDKAFFRGTFEHSLLFNATQDDVQSFAEAHGYDMSALKFQSYDVFTSYMEKFEEAKQLVYINSILCLVAVLLEVLIISLLVRMQYTVNAVELTVQRVFGYSVFERNKILLLLTVITSVLAAVAALVVNHIAELTTSVNILIGSAGILALELPVIFYNIQKLEKTNMQKLLKGGTL